MREGVRGPPVRFMVIFRKSVRGASEQSLARFVAQARRAAGLRGRVAVLITSSRELRNLNRRFRGKDAATDVLSFPAAPELSEGAEGDIAISADIAAANAVRLGHRPTDELKVLVLHGLLHLAGYDHETDNGEMERRETRLRRELGLPETLIARTIATASPVGQRSLLKSARPPVRLRKRQQ